MRGYVSLMAQWWADRRMAMTSYLRRSDSMVDVAVVAAAGVVLLVGALWQGASQDEPAVEVSADLGALGDEVNPTADLGARATGSLSPAEGPALDPDRSGERDQPDGTSTTTTTRPADAPVEGGPATTSAAAPAPTSGATTATTAAPSQPTSPRPTTTTSRPPSTTRPPTTTTTTTSTTTTTTFPDIIPGIGGD